MVGNSYPESLISLFCNLLPLVLLFSFLSVLPAIKDRRVCVCVYEVAWCHLSGWCMETKWNSLELHLDILTNPRVEEGNGGTLANVSRNWGSQSFASSRNSEVNGFGWLETEQQPATTECFIAVWKCLFSEHKFKGQIQGMSRNKAYHHVS